MKSGIGMCCPCSEMPHNCNGKEGVAITNRMITPSIRGHNIFYGRPANSGTAERNPETLPVVRVEPLYMFGAVMKLQSIIEKCLQDSVDEMVSNDNR